MHAKSNEPPPKVSAWKMSDTTGDAMHSCWFQKTFTGKLRDYFFFSGFFIDA